MKVLFLDIDGVLNSVRSSVAFGGYPMEPKEIAAFDQIAIGLLQRLCHGAGLQVVLSSAWRTLYDFRAVGEAFNLPIIDRTPSLPGSPRGGEIAAWLAQRPQVERYAIVDDNADMLPEQMPRFVQTCCFDGLRWIDYVRLCSIFGTSPDAGKPRARNWRTGEAPDERPRIDEPQPQPQSRLMERTKARLRLALAAMRLDRSAPR